MRVSEHNRTKDFLESPSVTQRRCYVTEREGPELDYWRRLLTPGNEVTQNHNTVEALFNEVLVIRNDFLYPVIEKYMRKKLDTTKGRRTGKICSL